MKSVKPKIMIASTIYGFENELDQIIAYLEELEYDVINSFKGKMKVNSNLSNLDNCLRAVEDCDLFVGIIRPFYGSGIIDEKNITFEEIKKSIELNKPRWFLVHRDVVFARKLFREIEKCGSIKDFSIDKIPKTNFFDARTIQIYNHVVEGGKSLSERTGNWVQEYFKMNDIIIFLESQFKDKNFINDLLK